VLSYALWFRGLDRLPATSLSLLSLSSPVMATLLGFLVLGQSLSGWQLLGFAVALGALVAGQLGVRVKADDAVAQSSSSMRTLPRVFGRT
jgi:probable blue pigment (indigoidine) exporter